MTLPAGARILPPDEWHKLAATDLGPVCHALDPDVTSIVVMERDGQIIACWALFPRLMCPGLWVDPQYRRSRVGWRLWQAMKAVVKDRGGNGFVTTACSAEIKFLIEHVGGISMGEEFVVNVE